MRWVGRIALVVFVGVISVIAVALVRTVTYRPPGEVSTADVRVVDATPVDVDGAARRLSGAIQIRTVSHQDIADDQPGEWDRLRGYLEGAYPAAHAAMTRDVVGQHTLVYTWKGSDPALAPIVLMAHQ